MPWRRVVLTVISKEIIQWSVLCIPFLALWDVEILFYTRTLEPIEITVLCPFHELGCKAEICRQDLARHIETDATIFAKSHKTLNEQHESLKEELAKLKVEFYNVCTEHNALENKLSKDLDELKKKNSAKLKAIKTLPHSPAKHRLAQVLTILADHSRVKMDDSIDLVLSESNKKSGCHWFTYTHSPHELMLRIEWERDIPISTAKSCPLHYFIPTLSFQNAVD